MTRSFCLLLGVMIGLAPFAGCDPSTSITRLSLFGFARDGLVEDCCACLVAHTATVYAPSLACPEVEVPLAGEIDGGCPTGAACEDGLPEELAIKTPCLCGELDKDGCFEELSSGRNIQVIGRCLDNAGICTDACSGVLAYEGDPTPN